MDPKRGVPTVVGHYLCWMKGYSVPFIVYLNVNEKFLLGGPRGKKLKSVEECWFEGPLPRYEELEDRWQRAGELMANTRSFEQFRGRETDF